VNRRRRVLAVAAGVIALAAGTTACSSTPGNRRVLTDLIEGYVVTSEVTEAEGECMHERLAGYDDDELEAIAQDNDDITQTNQEQWSDELRALMENFASCVNGEVTASTPTSEPQGTEPAETDSADGTAAPTTEPESTAAPATTEG
jgi:hypothetical protein